MTILAVDFGGTRIRAAWFEEHDSALRLICRVEAMTNTRRPRDQVIQSIIDTARAVVPHGAVPERIGIAAPGPLDAARGVIYHAFTLPGWDETPLAAILSASFGNVRAFMQNDGNLAALAEYTRGAGQGCDPLLYLTLSTGIGGGAVINGQLFTGWQGMAIEPGHMRFVVPDGTTRRWEELCSGTGIADRARDYLQTHATSSVLRGLDQITAPLIGRAAMQGDSAAQQIIADTGRWLGLGLVNILHLFNPRAVVLGGSVINLGGRLLDPARAIVRQEVLHSAFLAEDLIRVAALGDDVCLFGAALYALNMAG